MASATPSQPSTKETSNYAQLCRLLVEVGSLMLREIFDRVCPPENLHAVLTNPTNHAKLQTLRKKSPEYLPVGETVSCLQNISFLREL